MLKHNRAIIIGEGIAGKLAARVLADFFNEVIILERDRKPDGPIARKGAPQGEHLHALLFAGQYGLEKLFPGISEKFHAGGAIKINSTKDLAWFHHGVWKLRFDGGYTTTLQTRPHLEWHIQQYMKELSNVTILYNQVVQNYLHTNKSIAGVVLQDGTQLSADLVVDASGVNGFTAAWLHKQGVQIPKKSVKIGLSYISKTFRLPETKERDWAIKIVYPSPPQEKIGGTISKVEGDRYIVTLNGYHDVINEKEVLKYESGFVDLAKKLPKLDIYDEIKDATPLSKTSLYKVPHITWRHYNQVKDLPEGLLLIGDAICRIDPVFGQGMSIAVLQALALQKLCQKKSSLQQVTKSFHKQANKIISPIWNMVVSEDFRYPETTGQKPIGLSFQQWYAKNIFLLSSKHELVYDSLVKVMNLVSPMTILMHPRILMRVLKRTFTR